MTERQRCAQGELWVVMTWNADEVRADRYYVPVCLPYRTAREAYVAFADELREHLEQDRYQDEDPCLDVLLAAEDELKITLPACGTSMHVGPVRLREEPV